MTKSKPNKRDSSNANSFLVKQDSQQITLTYLFDEQESTALESVFNELFKRVEDNYLTNSENISDKL